MASIFVCMWSLFVGFQKFESLQILTQNGLIDVTETYEENEQIVNNVYFRTIAADNYNFTEAQISDLASVAYQCPLAGGAAVYRARGMYQTATGFVFFDDTDLCHQQNINWKKAEVKTTKIENISIYPNPANDVLNIYFTDKYQHSNIVIYNSMGQKITENVLPANSTNYQMSVKYFASGIYFVKIGDFVQKFVIQH